MAGFSKHQGIAAPLDRANVDTDQIIPKQFLTKVEKTGFGQHCFHNWRYLDDDPSRPNPDFILNQPRYAQASVLLARENFGSGSSREHAPWALKEMGYLVVIAPSFADIFYGNALNNFMLPIQLDETIVNKLFQQVVETEGAEISVDLETMQVTGPDGNRYPFTLDAFHRESLIRGLDSIGWTLQHQDKIATYETAIPNWRR